MTRTLLTCCLALAAGPVAAADLAVAPATVTLDGPRAAAQLVATGRDADGDRDLTRAARWVSDAPGVVAVSASGSLTPVGDGVATVTAGVGDRSTPVRVTVRGFGTPQPVGFRDEVIPALNRAGCNAGACHGTPNGKGGFKLSLRGYDPPFDYQALTRDAFGRRTHVASPDDSLLLLKGSGRTLHQGGVRFGVHYPEYQLLRRWIAEGLRPDPADLPELVRLEVLPARREIKLRTEPGANEQQLAVVAHFADGSARDVTRLTCFSTSDDTIATVSADGLVAPARRGEVAVLCRYLSIIASARLTFLEDRPGYAWPADAREQNVVDTHVFAKLRLLQIPPSPLAGDLEFLRRAYLDAVGVPPTPDEIRAFLADTRKDKRDRAIDALLARPEFTDFWTMKWADVLRLNERFMGDADVVKLHRYVRDWIARDKPLDEFVRVLLTAKGTSRETVTVNYLRTMLTPEDAAENVAQLFLGVRMGCAKCHNHPFEKWTQDDYYGLAAFFGPMTYWDPSSKNRPSFYTLKLDPARTVTHLRTGQVMAPRLPGGQPLGRPTGDDPRVPFAEWLTSKQNPFFAKTLANRTWFHLVGRGIVEPVDDFRDSNPAVNDPLLDALAAELTANGYRLRPLVRLIMRSRTYQTSALPNALNKDDELYFSRALVRILTAEQLLDTVSQVTGVPEAYPGVPMGGRASQVPGAKAGSLFLQTFNRPLRNLACECERERDANLAQALQLISSRTVHRKIVDPNGRVAKLAASKLSDDAAVEELYLAALCRRPSPREQAAVRAAVAEAGRREALEDLAWSLLNSKEFQFRH
jgi:hypothetical protein